MCGLTGFFSPGGFRAEDGSATATRMRDTLVHRGPDDSGTWLDADAGIALGHRRLSIVDLSAAGHQPMPSHSGRYVLAFNGEIYNHVAIRGLLDQRAASPPAWRGHSDTETLLAAIDAWGLERALQESAGMFALALWDREERALSLARDRLGEKPLYWGWQGKTLLFGSETKALRMHPDFRSEIDREALPLYLRHGYVPAPRTIWAGTRKLIPGTIVRLDAASVGEFPAPRPYWSIEDAIEAGSADPYHGSDEEAIAALEERLRTSIAGQMMADVPLGAFLSGGVDSSAVVALMQSQSSRPVKTFTIGFAEAGYNEAEHAKAVARHLGTEHTELYVDSATAATVIPKLPAMYDEPFGDSSAIPTHLISELARGNVTVSLSGDGGDEQFGGYSRYFNPRAERAWRASRSLPGPLRAAAVGALRSGLVPLADGLLYRARRKAGRPRDRAIGARAEIIAALASCRTQDEFYRVMTSHWQWPPVARPGAVRTNGSPARYRSLSGAVERMMAIDSVSYLPDDILVKVDRAAMAVSLETRVPLLDHRVVEFAWRLPLGMKVREGQGKWILRQVLYRHVPRALIERPKMGFAVPVDEWLRGPLRSWGEDLLSASRLRQQGLLDPDPIRARWRQHVERRHNWRDSLWLVLMFQAWMETA
jgi:asparagine synthase (glutamine-hydrolysing)